ncbi:MAG: type II toxin-antitoxin system RelE/ParE family toxin [Proteobacteria bacterium]|nr:type II toxin-antitoxin system RelE/ParE family toxin [Pseudomonadota bacterium]
MAEVIISAGADADLERLVGFLLELEPAAALATFDRVLGGLAVLERYPLIGQPADQALRELFTEARLAMSRCMSSTRRTTGPWCLPCGPSAKSAIWIATKPVDRQSG